MPRVTAANLRAEQSQTSSCYPLPPFDMFIHREEASSHLPIASQGFPLHQHRPALPQCPAQREVHGPSLLSALDTLLVANQVPLARVPSLALLRSAMGCAQRSEMPYPKVVVQRFSAHHPRPRHPIHPHPSPRAPKRTYKDFLFRTKLRSWFTLGSNAPPTILCVASDLCPQRSVCRYLGIPRRISQPGLSIKPPPGSNVYLQSGPCPLSGMSLSL